VTAPAEKPEQAGSPKRRPSTTRRTSTAAHTTTPARATGRAAAAEPDELASLTVAQLRDRAKSAGKTGYSRLSKAQLVALLS
jgi:hypothetical protein